MDDNFFEHLKEAVLFFISNFLELTILFLAVSFLVEILNIFLNPKKVQRVLSSNKGGYLIASAMGSLTPFCSCSTIPLTLGLLKARAAFGPIMTFLFTSPLLNPIIVAVFWSAFGYEVTLIYALIAFFVSIFAGFLLEKFGFEKYIKNEIFKDDNVNCSCCKTINYKIKKENSCCTPSVSFSLTFSDTKKQSRLKQIANKELIKKTWKQFLSFVPYIAIGIGIGAFVHGFIPENWLATYASSQNFFAVPISALVGVPLYIRADAMVGLAPALLDKGVSMGSILALTVAGAGASLPEMIMLKKIFRLPIMIFFIISVFTMAIGCGYLVNLYFA